MPMSQNTRTILKGVVYHVGNLPKRPSPRRRPRAGTSYEGAGLSVSEVPTAWRSIVRLGGLALYALERVDGREGQFVDLTGDRVYKYAPQAVRRGLVRRSELYRVWTTDEDEQEQYMEFDNLRAAEVEAESYEGDARIERADGFVPTDKLRALWRKDFTGPLGSLSALVLNIAVLYMLDESSDADGAWWDEDLDVDRLSAPRGVIFPSKLQHWQAHKIPWSEAPDSDLYE
jgi:hypothetical protein